MATVNLPNPTFTAGTTAVGSQVIANFNAILTAVNGNIETANIKDNTVTDAKIQTVAASKLTTLTGVQSTAGILPNVNTVGGSINVFLDGAGGEIAANTKIWMVIPQAITITGAYMYADVSGSAIVDIWTCTDAQYDAFATHPAAGDKITASAPPTIATATKSSDVVLTGWTTVVTAGKIMAFNVTSCTSITKLSIVLTFNRA